MPHKVGDSENKHISFCQGKIWNQTIFGCWSVCSEIGQHGGCSLFWALDPSVVSLEWVRSRPGLNSLHGSASKFFTLSLSLAVNVNIDCKDIFDVKSDGRW